jgi:hypothetical protein
LGVTYTEQVGSESPSRLETQIDVGGVHEGTAAKPNEEGTEGENDVTLVWQIVEGLKRIEGEVVHMLIVDGLDTLHLELLLFIGECWCVEGVRCLGVGWAVELLVQCPPSLRFDRMWSSALYGRRLTL